MKQLIVAVAAVAVLAGSSVRAQDPPEHRGPPPGGGPRMEMPLIPPRMMQELQLTDEQRPKVGGLADEFDKKRDEIRAAQKKDPAFVKLQEEIKTARDTRNREKIQELRPKMAEYQKPIIDLRKQTMDKVRALLTPEQIKTLDAARERLQERRGGHGGNGPAGGPPPPPPPKED